MKARKVIEKFAQRLPKKYALILSLSASFGIVTSLIIAEQTWSVWSCLLLVASTTLAYGTKIASQQIPGRFLRFAHLSYFWCSCLLALLSALAHISSYNDEHAGNPTLITRVDGTAELLFTFNSYEQINARHLLRRLYMSTTSDPAPRVLTVRVFRESEHRSEKDQYGRTITETPHVLLLEHVVSAEELQEIRKYVSYDWFVQNCRLNPKLATIAHLVLRLEQERSWNTHRVENTNFERSLWPIPSNMLSSPVPDIR